MSSNADLPDLNVWLALATPDYFHHQLALNYWEQKAAEQVHFCTVTALGLVSLIATSNALSVFSRSHSAQMGNQANQL